MDCISEHKAKLENNAVEKNQLHEINLLAGELKRLLVHYRAAFTESGIENDMLKLEEWLESQVKGVAPAGIISESGIRWLCAIRDRLKLSADEIQRLEGEGGNPVTKEQAQKMEDLLKAIRKIDKIVDESSVVTSH